MEWFAVRHVLQKTEMFEERITVWQATSEDEAIALAEREAAEYAGEWAVLDLFQCFWLFEPPAHGREVFSLIRTNSLAPAEYIDAFFDTGTEHQRPG